MLRILALLLATLPAAMAHDGAHHPGSVIWHVLTQPDHLAVLGAGLAAVLVVAWAVRRHRRAAAERR